MSMEMNGKNNPAVLLSFASCTCCRALPRFQKWSMEVVGGQICESATRQQHLSTAFNEEMLRIWPMNDHFSCHGEKIQEASSYISRATEVNKFHRPNRKFIKSCETVEVT
jgi:hypothetical protein